jgi:hypothetical protein
MAGLITWVIIDYKVMNNELLKCPKCSHKIRKPFSATIGDKRTSFTAGAGRKFQLRVYQCPKCGYGWNYVKEDEGPSH